MEKKGPRNLKHKNQKIIAVALAALLVTGVGAPVIAANAPVVSAAETKAAPARASAAAVIEAALAEVGYTERKDEYTKFGAWYGLSNAYWCDMFVSWCANQAGVSASIFPHSASCTAHVNQFQQQGRFYASASRGGSYTPQQGDVIFFYNPKRRPNGNVSGHVGLVLYVENGVVHTIEGNALSNRLDYGDGFLLDQREGKNDPPDRVTVNHYPLDNVRILGYAVPNYKSRSTLTLNGFVDLGSYADRSAMFTKLHDAGILTATSSHTYSPRHGMSRGDFVTALMKAAGLSSSGGKVAAYADVPSSASCYDAVMAARSLGILEGSERFEPNRYISGSEAQRMISRVQALLGKAERTFSFSPGDYADYGEYTIRADLASALYALYTDAKTAYTASFVTGDTDSAPPSAAVSSANQVVLPTPSARTGSTFLGWKSSADQMVYPAGKTVTLKQNTVFTAQWQTNDTATAAKATSASSLLDTSAVTLVSGQSYLFLVKGNRTPASIQAASANATVADVSLYDATDARGTKYRITAGTPGSTSLAVTANGQTANLNVTVETPKASLALDTAQYTLAAGKQYTIGVRVTDETGKQLEPAQIKQLIDKGTLTVRDSRTGSIVDLEILPNGNARITGKHAGTAYILYEMGTLRTFVRVDVTG